METRKQAPSSTVPSASGHWRETDARKILSELAASGESVKKFAQRRGLSPKRLWHWRKRLAEPGAKGARVAAATFLPVMVKAEAEKEATATLVLKNQLRVELCQLNEATATWVAQLVSALEAGR